MSWKIKKYNTAAIKNQEASLTVEAALILPLCLYIMIGFLYFYQILQMQEQLYFAAVQTVEEISDFGFMIDQFKEDKEGVKKSNIQPDNLNPDSLDQKESDIFLILSDIIPLADIKDMVQDQMISSVIKWWVLDKLKSLDYLQPYISGGFSNIDFDGSCLLDDDEMTTVLMTYQIKIPLLGKLFPYLPVMQKVSIRSFNGYKIKSKFDIQDKTEDTGDIVYITENGTVYHTNLNCTHLMLSTQKIEFNQIEEIRNRYGGKYYACERCMKNYTMVYVTDTGTRYHGSKECGNLKRIVKEISLSEVSGRKICERCSKK